MRAPLDVMSDGSERVRYNRPGFAVFAYRTHLSDYPRAAYSATGTTIWNSSACARAAYATR